MTEETKSHGDLSRSFRALRLLSLSNKALFRANDENILLADICRLIVVEGGYLMAWVGIPLHDRSKSILPFCSYGIQIEYLEKLNLTWADTEKGRTPTSTALREGVTQINQDFMINPALAAYRESALARGCLSSIALPLIDKGKVLGALSIYARETNAFIPEEVKILEELVSDLAYGLQTLRMSVQAGTTAKQLERKKEQFRQVVNMTNEGIWSIDAGHMTDFVNAALCDKLGYRTEEIVGRPMEDFIFEADREEFRETIFKIHSGASFKQEQRFRRSDGSEFWGLFYSTPFKDEHVHFQGAFAMIADITERKLAEARLKSTTRLFASIAENVPNMIFLKRASDLAYEYLNPAGEKLTGIKRDLLLNHTDYDFFPREQADFFCAKDRETLNQQGLVDIPEETVNTVHGPRILHTKKVVVRDEQEQPLFLLGISEDITELKQTQAKLLERESQYRVAIETSPDGFWLVDMQGRILEVNSAYVRMSGYGREELLGKNVHELDAQESAELVAQRMAELQQSGYSRFETIHRKKNGRLWPVAATVTFSPEKGGQIFAFFTDLTERMAGEKTSKMHAAILSQMIEGIYIFRASDYTIAYTTPVFDRMFGYERNEVIGKPVSILNAPGANISQEDVSASINKVLVETGNWQGEINNIKKDGTRLTCWVKISSFEHHEFGKVWVAMHEDITERKREELELQKSRESVYRDVLIREVHHRIKNNLQGVIGVLRLSSSYEPQLAEPINEAIRQVQSIALIHGLQSQTEASKVGLCELTYAIAKNIELMLKKAILIDIPEGWLVNSIIESEAVPVALILNELITNAIKHGPSESSVSVRLLQAEDNHCVTIFIYNEGKIPTGFGFDCPEMLGTGLRLVSSLMPHAGAKLYWEQNDEVVATIFELSKPIIQPESYGFSTESSSNEQRHNNSAGRR